jgi:MoxR-like ATPase
VRRSVVCWAVTWSQRQALVSMQRCLVPEDVLALQKQVDRVHVSDAFLNYLQDLLGFYPNR